MWLCRHFVGFLIFVILTVMSFKNDIGIRGLIAGFARYMFQEL